MAAGGTDRRLPDVLRSKTLADATLTLYEEIAAFNVAHPEVRIEPMEVPE